MVNKNEMFVFDESTAISTGVTYAQEHYDNSKGDKNYFEDVVQQMMLNKYDDNVRDYIYSLPKRERRRAIFSLLGQDRMIFNEIEEKRRTLPKMEYLKWAIYKFKDFVKIAETDTKKFGEVLTPMELVKEMVQTIPEDFWTYKDKKILDPANGNGNFLLMSIYRFMFGLKDVIPDEEERYKWIVEKLIYACELQPINMFLWIYLIDPFDEYLMNVYTGSFLKEEFDYHMKNVWGVEKFSLILGNPPYQEELITKKGSAKPLYNLFIDKCLNITDRLLFIVPSRWMCGGKGLDIFRKNMLNRNDIKFIKNFKDSKEIFGSSVEIKGGVQYFLIDKNYRGLTEYNGKMCKLNIFDIFVDDKYINILNKIIDNSENFLNEICIGQSYAGVTSNDPRLKNYKETDDDILCYVSIQKGIKKYIDKTKLKNIPTLNKYKVFTSRSYGAGPAFSGHYYIGHPQDICNQSYICFIVDSENDAKSLITYIKTKFANKLLSIRKNTQDIKPDTCKWIPMVPLDRELSDEKLYEYFKLSEEEIKLIESDD